MVELPNAIVLRRNLALLAVPAILTVVGAALAIAGIAGVAGPDFAGPGGIAHLLGIALWVYVWFNSPLPRVRRVDVRADERGLFYGDELVWPRERVVEAYLLPGRRPDKPPRVRISDKLGLRETDVLVGSDEAGSELVEAMHLGASRAVRTFRVLSPPARSGVSILLTIVLGFGLAKALFRALPDHEGVGLVGLLALFAAAAFPMKIEVGADGVRTSWLGIARFIAHKDIARVGGDDSCVRLELRSGGARYLCLRVFAVDGAGRPTPVASAIACEKLAASIERARTASALTAAEESAAALLRPDARPVRAWIAEMRALGAGATATFRAPSVPETSLWAILESPSIDEAARAGAAVALSGSLDEGKRRRMRIAAEATIAPKVRVALEAAASGDDEAIADAVEALRDEVGTKAGHHGAGA